MEQLVVRPGQEVIGWGPVVRDGDGDWFGPNLSTRLIVEPIRHSTLAVRAAGIDIDNVDNRRRDNVGITGTATVSGLWTGDAIEVSEQARGCPAWALPAYPSWNDPPCPPPPSGWPSLPADGGGNLRFDSADLEASGAAISMCTFRPTPQTAVLVVAAGNPERVDAHLRPQLGDALCVVHSRFTRTELDDTRAILDAQHQTWGSYGWGESVDETGQPLLTVEAVMLTEAIAEQLATFPPGIVDFKPWLRPLSAVPQRQT